MATLEEEYKNYQQTQNTDQINSMYDAQKQSQLAGLESAYNQSMSNAQAARDAIPQQYQARANDLATQYERQRRNLNQQAAANGLNTGAGSQMQLALGSNFQRDYGGIRTAQQQALDTADRGIRDLQSAYQSQVQQAVANNDYERAQALLAEYKNQYQRQLQQAQTLASYGDFSAYLNIPGYNQGQVDSMRNAWIASNPQLAYNTGAISADQYYQMTGKWPAGYTQPGAGSVYNPGYNPTPTPGTPVTDPGKVPGVARNPDGSFDVSELAGQMADSPDHGRALFDRYAGAIGQLPEAQQRELGAAMASSYQTSPHGQIPRQQSAPQGATQSAPQGGLNFWEAIQRANKRVNK